MAQIVPLEVFNACPPECGRPSLGVELADGFAPVGGHIGMVFADLLPHDGQRHLVERYGVRCAVFVLTARNPGMAKCDIDVLPLQALHVRRPQPCGELGDCQFSVLRLRLRIGLLHDALGDWK